MWASGRVASGIEDFKKSFEYFKWMNIYVIPHTYRAVSLVVAECQKVVQMSLFATVYGKIMSLTDFCDLQNKTTKQVSMSC